MGNVRLLCTAVCFAAGLARAVDLDRGPYLQLKTPSSIVVRWATDVPAESQVRYGTSPTALTQMASDSALKNDHAITLLGLQSGTRYYYSVETSAAVLSGGSDHTFVTAPNPGSRAQARVWVVGDSGTADSHERAMRDAYAAFTGATPTDVWLMLGDNAYNNGTVAEFDAAVFDMFPALLRQTVLWPAVGNHDAELGPSSPYFDLFTLPAAGEAGGMASGTERYYSYDHGAIHFIALDTELSSYAPGSTMLTWLAADLAATTADWIVAYFHRPVYSRGGFNTDTDSDLIALRQNVLPILEGGVVDLVFVGHSHSYERSMFIDGHYGTSGTLTPAMIKDGGTGGPATPYVKPKAPHAGTVYVVAGSAARLSNASLDHPVMLVSLNERGTVVLDFDGLRMDAIFLRNDGMVRDNFSIIKRPVLTVASTGGEAAEFGPVTGVFTISSNVADAGAPLDVSVSFGGTAESGADYGAMPAAVVIPGGSASVQVPLVPIPDALPEGSETVTLTLQAGAGYMLGTPASAALVIRDRPIDEWRVLHFGAAAATPEAADLADADDDGYSNLLEHALSLNPLTPDASAILTPTVVDGVLAVRYTRPKFTDVTIVPQVGSTPADGGTWQSANQMLIADDGVSQTIEARDFLPMQNLPERFMRVRVQR